MFHSLPLYITTEVVGRYYKKYPITSHIFMFCLLVRGCRPGKTVQMTEQEVRGLCMKSREIFLSQPILLELEAPLKICGKLHSHICKSD